MNDKEKLKHAFESTPSIFKLLTTIRSRRVGRGYRIDSGTSIEHPATGRTIAQAAGPMKFVSKKDPKPLTRVEEALIAWSACGPNGLIAWDISMDGGFHELTWIPGRTCPSPGNSLATDLLVINDSGAYIYKPTRSRSAPIEIQSENDYDKVLKWYDEGLVQILDQRPDIDFGLRSPGAPNATLMGPYQFNMNMPGSTWFIPISDSAWLNSVLINMFDFWHTYLIDEWNGGRPAGTAKWIKEGMLELPTTIAASEQGLLQSESYPVGCMVQNMRLVCEAMGLGAWVYCGFNPDILMGAMPDIARGLGFHVEAPNPKAPVSTGQVKIFGIEGIKEATYVPSPRFKSAEQLVNFWYDEKYGPGGPLARRDDNYLRKVGSPWNKDTTEQIINHPRNQPAEWVREAIIAYIDYCVKTFGQWPVTYNPMQAHFGCVVHNVDVEFYDTYYKVGYVTDRIRNRDKIWG
ncbi:MAG TPA: hypothetical protein VEU51_17490 [Candidatus Acidoferrales bacterium]|nr:hypothetical protein [Candidatus Acidoferrales bacterium]